MDVHGEGFGQGTLGEQQVAVRGPGRELRARPGVARVYQPPLRSRDADRHALRCVRHAARLETHLGIQRERLTVPHVEHADREAGVEEPRAEPLRESLHQAHGAGWTQDHQRILARRLRGMPQGEDEHRGEHKRRDD